MNKTQMAFFGLAALCLSAQVVAQKGFDEEVDSGALIEEARQQERWIHDVDSFLLRMEGTWTKTPEAIAKHRAELERLYRDLDDFDPMVCTGLRPRVDETLEIAFDSERVRCLTHWPGSRYDLCVWDGEQAIAQEGRDPERIESYAIDDEPDRIIGGRVMAHLNWLRAEQHGFWWDPATVERIGGDTWHPDEGFRLVGREEFRGVPCYVIESLNSLDVWYVGVEDHILYGISARVIRSDVAAEATELVLRQVAEGWGEEFQTYRKFVDWMIQQDPDERSELERLCCTVMRRYSRPMFERFLLDYREVAPGKWFPARQGMVVFAEEPDDDGEYPVARRHELRLAEIRIDEPLDDALFTLRMKEGVRVFDERFDVTLEYFYEENIPEDKLQALLEKERVFEKYRKEGRIARGALIGRAAFPFPETQWLNSDPLTWEDLRGKVVVLDFWAEWCSPCRGDLPIAAEAHLQSEETGIIIIGIHNPGSAEEKIKEVMDKFKMHYPVCIDVAIDEEHPFWGLFAERYGVDGIPRAFVIDQEGNIAGQGRLEEVLKAARALARRGR